MVSEVFSGSEGTRVFRVQPERGVDDSNLIIDVFSVSTLCILGTLNRLNFYLSPFWSSSSS